MSMSEYQREMEEIWCMYLKMEIWNWSESEGSGEVIYEVACGKGRKGLAFEMGSERNGFLCFAMRREREREAVIF